VVLPALSVRAAEKADDVRALRAVELAEWLLPRGRRARSSRGHIAR
jgi:hypothetical protein